MRFSFGFGVDMWNLFGAGAAPVSFSSTVPDCAASAVAPTWSTWDAANIGTVLGEWSARAAHITKDGSNLVSQVNDLRGTNHLTQSGGARPLYEATGLGSDEDISTNGSTTWIGSGSVFTSALSGSDKPYTFAIIHSVTPTNNGYIWSLDGDAASEGMDGPRFSVTTLVKDRTDDAGAGAGVTIDLDTSGVNVYIFSFTGTAVTVWKNGTKIVNAAAQNVGSCTLDWLTLGGRRPIGLGLLNVCAIKFRHLILISSAISADNDAANLNSYLAHA